MKPVLRTKAATRDGWDMLSMSRCSCSAALEPAFTEAFSKGAKERVACAAMGVSERSTLKMLHNECLQVRNLTQIFPSGNVGNVVAGSVMYLMRYNDWLQRRVSMRADGTSLLTSRRLSYFRPSVD